MNRRDALERVALMLGGTISVPVVSGVLAGCGTGGTDVAWAPQTFSADQDSLVSHIAEMIIPETDTPGAAAAGVNRFIDKMLSDWLPADDRDHFLAGVADVDSRALAEYGSSFMEATPTQQVALLRTLDEAAYAPDGGPARPAFFRMMKELTLVGYYTSEIGATQELQWLAVPGRNDSCAPLEEIGRSWA